MSAFEEWLLKKSRLERGQKVLSSLLEHNLNSNYFNDTSSSSSSSSSSSNNNSNNAKSKQELLDELILCCVAIDCSIQILQNKTILTNNKQSSSMKASLRKFLIQQRYSFEGIIINKDMYDKFSDHGKEIMFEMVDDDIKMISCAYTIKDKDTTLDQTLTNVLFNVEYSRQWKHGLNTLSKKCIESCIVESECLVAECKQPSHDRQDHENKNEEEGEEEVKGFTKCSSKQNCEAKDVVFLAEPKHDRKEVHYHDNEKRNIFINGTELGISKAKLHRFLSFGIRRLVEIEKEYLNRKKDKELAQVIEKKIEANKAHERWIERKKELTRLRDIDETNSYQDEVDELRVNKYTNLLMSSRFQRKNRDKPARNIAMPKLSFTRCIDDPCKITIYWSSPNKLLDSDFFLISIGKEDDDNNASKIWRDPLKPGGTKQFMKEVDIDLSSSYWISARIFTSDGASPESRSLIPCKPLPPSAPLLLKASDSSVKISWIQPSKEKLNKNDSYIVELCIDDEEDEWIGIWKGQHNTATLSGLNPDTGYKIRVHFRNGDGLRSFSGDSSIVYTMLKRPNAPRLVDGDNSIGESSVELCWDKMSSCNDGDNDVSSLSVSKCFSRLNDQQGTGINIDKVLFNLGVIGGDDIVQDMKAYFNINGEQILLDQFLKWWNTYVTFTLYLRKYESDSDPQVVYKGTDTSVKLEGLSENTSHYFNIVYSTLRGTSTESKSICILTRPSCAKEIIPIHVDVDHIILKVLFKKGCKIKLEKSDASKVGQVFWSTVYEGSNEIVKVTNLRPDRAYQFRCQRVNQDGKCSVFKYSKNIKTTTQRFIFNIRIINKSFTIDCTNAITTGDLILFSEIEQAYFKRYKKNREEKCQEQCIIARVMNIDTPKIRPEGLLNMEIVWLSESEKKQNHLLEVGRMIKRSLIQICMYEVLRMPWMNEDKRV